MGYSILWDETQLSVLFSSKSCAFDSWALTPGPFSMRKPRRAKISGKFYLCSSWFCLKILPNNPMMYHQFVYSHHFRVAPAALDDFLGIPLWGWGGLVV
jgi:hypothetical protein